MMATRSAQKESAKKAVAGKTANTSSIPKKMKKGETSTEKKTSANFTEEQVYKMIDEVKNKKQKAKILKENGIHVKEAETEKAWERFMQEALENLKPTARRRRKARATKKCKAAKSAVKANGRSRRKKRLSEWRARRARSLRPRSP